MLELRAIRAGYPGNPVLWDVDLRVPQQSVVVLLGANGVGKTTLLNVVSGLLTPTRGSVWIDGVDVTKHRGHKRAQLGLCHIPEGRGIFPTLTVRDNLKMAPRQGGEPFADIVDLVAKAFPVLGRRMSQQAGTLSGGEQQMLSLARAYVTRPRYVLIDEVSMGLSPVLVDETFAFLRKLADRGSALLMVEQYAQRALALADFTFVLSKGRVVFAGEASEVDMERLADDYLGVGVG
jgi:branched-chain amino acid transport system ATP-binding protein